MDVIQVYSGLIISYLLYGFFEVIIFEVVNLLNMDMFFEKVCWFVYNNLFSFFEKFKKIVYLYGLSIVIISDFYMVVVFVGVRVVCI